MVVLFAGKSCPTNARLVLGDKSEILYLETADKLYLYSNPCQCKQHYYYFHNYVVCKLLQYDDVYVLTILYFDLAVNEYLLLFCFI